MAVTKDSKTIQDEYKENYETLAEGFRALDAEYKTLQTALQSGQLANGMNTKVADLDTAFDMLHGLYFPVMSFRMRFINLTRAFPNVL